MSNISQNGALKTLHKPCILNSASKNIYFKKHYLVNRHFNV